jgi:AraC family transcriptional regulator
MTYEKENLIRINSVKKYIEENIGGTLSLTELAEQANCSPFHFQRLFKSLVGETPKQYIQRIRLEGASHFIALKPTASMLEAALEFGFTSLESFSRAFKNHYKISPDGFRKESDEGKIAILLSKTNNTIAVDLLSASSAMEHQEELNIQIIKLPKKRVVYTSITLTDVEVVTNSYKKVKQWALARYVATQKSELFGLLLDYPLFTSLDKCRLHVCIVVDTKPEVSGTINYMEIPSQTYASFKAKGGMDALIKHVAYLHQVWLPESGFRFSLSPAILVPLENPLTHHQHDIVYQVHIAVVPT